MIECPFKSPQIAHKISLARYVNFGQPDQLNYMAENMQNTLARTINRKRDNISEHSNKSMVEMNSLYRNYHIIGIILGKWLFEGGQNRKIFFLNINVISQCQCYLI